MDNNEITHQDSLLNDSFSTIERLEADMATITREFEALDSTKQQTVSDSESTLQAQDNELDGNQHD